MVKILPTGPSCAAVFHPYSSLMTLCLCTHTAEALRLPFLPPYLKLAGGPYVKTGVNFAVVGATALDAEFFYARDLGPILLTNDSLSVQVGWFKKWKSSICTTKQGNVLFRSTVSNILNNLHRSLYS